MSCSMILHRNRLINVPKEIIPKMVHNVLFHYSLFIMHLYCSYLVQNVQLALLDRKTNIIIVFRHDKHYSRKGVIETQEK